MTQYDSMLGFALSESVSRLMLLTESAAYYLLRYVNPRTPEGFSQWKESDPDGQAFVLLMNGYFVIRNSHLAVGPIL